jgi:hypothetical protein
MYLIGRTTPANDVGREPLVVIEGRATDTTPVENRPILHVNNYRSGTGLLVDHTGYVGIGTSEPQAALDITGGPAWAVDPNGNQWGKALSLKGREAIEFVILPGQPRFGIGSRGNGNELYFMTMDGSGPEARTANRMVLRSNGRVGIGTILPRTLLDVNGTTTTQVLRITGGADLAEPFTIAGADAVESGMVVALDPDNPGHMRVAAKEYDPLVAGIISGAGGIPSGLIMQQEKATIVGAQHPVALTGKVYAKAVGPIKVGDLLTTSEMPGHAMAATDRTRAFGTTLGKAMSVLPEGTGLVLVLVALQ